uniref:Uncharacterized protein n=1 Tax=Arundo donax TaxID=35708 RepID=A0A0A8XPL1_ARUDO
MAEDGSNEGKQAGGRKTKMIRLSPEAEEIVAAVECPRLYPRTPDWKLALMPEDVQAAEKEDIAIAERIYQLKERMFVTASMGTWSSRSPTTRSKCFVSV